MVVNYVQEERRAIILRKIEVVPYRQEWKEMYEQEAAALKSGPLGNDHFSNGARHIDLLL
jgi:GrpB-like predicted nucleotidyltransferase (UPF0157 family)